MRDYWLSWITVDVGFINNEKENSEWFDKCDQKYTKKICIMKRFLNVSDCPNVARLMGFCYCMMQHSSVDTVALHQCYTFQLFCVHYHNAAVPCGTVRDYYHSTAMPSSSCVCVCLLSLCSCTVRHLFMCYYNAAAPCSIWLCGIAMQLLHAAFSFSKKNIHKKVINLWSLNLARNTAQFTL